MGTNLLDLWQKPGSLKNLALGLHQQGWLILRSENEVQAYFTLNSIRLELRALPITEELLVFIQGDNIEGGMDRLVHFADDGITSLLEQFEVTLKEYLALGYSVPKNHLDKCISAIDKLERLLPRRTPDAGEFAPDGIIQPVAIDSETGGLKGYCRLPNGDVVHGARYWSILEIALVIPNLTNLADVSNSFVVGIAHPRPRLSQWAIKQHTRSGLLARLETGEGFDYVASSNEQAEDYIINQLLERGIKPYSRQQQSGAVLLGNGIQFDHEFIDAQMPRLNKLFHYREANISSIPMLQKTVWKDMDLPLVQKQYGHTALADITESLIELQSYGDIFNK